jgi:hypothetical protein
MKRKRKDDIIKPTRYEKSSMAPENIWYRKNDPKRAVGAIIEMYFVSRSDEKRIVLLFSITKPRRLAYRMNWIMSNIIPLIGKKLMTPQTPMASHSICVILNLTPGTLEDLLNTIFNLIQQNASSIPKFVVCLRSYEFRPVMSEIEQVSSPAPF